LRLKPQFASVRNFRRSRPLSASQSLAKKGDRKNSPKSGNHLAG
jgi:hypothetical protein